MALRLGPNQHHAPAIEEAARTFGMSPGLLAAIIDAEAGRDRTGRWNPDCRNPRTSATGLAQFLDGTWRDLAGRRGGWLWTEMAARGLLDGAGRPVAGDAPLALRREARVAIMALGQSATANLAALRRAGLAPSDADETACLVYLAHHEGLAGAIAIMRGDLGEARAARLLAANLGPVRAREECARGGGASAAYRSWLLDYVRRRIVPSRYLEA